MSTKKLTDSARKNTAIGTEVTTEIFVAVEVVKSASNMAAIGTEVTALDFVAVEIVKSASNMAANRTELTAVNTVKCTTKNYSLTNLHVWRFVGASTPTGKAPRERRGWGVTARMQSSVILVLFRVSKMPTFIVTFISRDCGFRYTCGDRWKVRIVAIVEN